MKINSVFFKILHLTLLALLCASCGHKKSVQIVNRNKSTYNKSSFSSKDKYTSLKNKNLDSAKTSQARTSEAVVNRGNIEENHQVIIGAGDTLYSISKKYQTSLRDLIETNSLSAPYSLKVGTKITIPQQAYYAVKNGDTLYSVSRDLHMNINDIVALNNLKSPYRINAGELLKVKNNSEAVINEDKKSIAKEKNASSKQESAALEDSPKKSPAVVEKILEHKNNKFAWPIKGAIISKFGPKKGGLYNDGLNIRAKEGSPVKASEDGLVAYVGNELKGYGNLIIIKHSDGWITAYAHLSQTTVKRGEKIKKGKTIGAVGATGNVDSPQLYFGLRKGRDAVNPENYLITK